MHRMIFSRKTSNLIKVTIILMSLLFAGCKAPGGGIPPSNEPGRNAGVYIIKEAAHLHWFAAQTTNVTAHIRFEADIDMEKKEFDGIKNFEGSMDGNGKVIKNLIINGATTITGVGLIYSLENNGEIKNLTIESGSIKAPATGSSAGAFVGSTSGTITINDLVNNATVEANGSAGGIIGSTSGAITINNLVNNATVKTTGNESESGTGGIVGKTSGAATINNAHNSGIIAAGNSQNSGVGGIIGRAGGAATINNAGNSGAIAGGDSQAGGIVGRATDTSLKVNYAYNYYEYVLIVGVGNDKTITESYNLYTGGNEFDVKELDEAQFKDKDNFVGWDWNIWVMGANYPELK